jgi:hypothetical protein
MCVIIQQKAEHPTGLTKVRFTPPRYSANARTSASAFPSAAPSPQRIVGRLAAVTILAASSAAAAKAE